MGNSRRPAFVTAAASAGPLRGEIGTTKDTKYTKNVRVFRGLWLFVPVSLQHPQCCRQIHLKTRVNAGIGTSVGRPHWRLP